MRHFRQSGCTVNSYPNTSREAICIIFNEGLWYDPVRARTCDLLHERLTTKPTDAVQMR